MPVLTNACAAASLLLAVLGTNSGHAQSGFPYDRDMVLDAKPMRGSKRVPILAIAPDGRAQIDLWCKRGEGRVTIDGAAMMIAVGAMNDEPCTPERAQADEDMLTVLAQVAGWSLRGDVVTLSGARPLRFRLATN